MAQGDKRWFDLDITLKAVEATKPSGLIPGEGTITENPLGAIWETSPCRTLTYTQTQDSWLEPFIHSDICQSGWQAVQLWQR